MIPATGVLSRWAEGRYDNDWHNAPRQIFVVILEGDMEIVASDDPSKRAKSKDVLLQDDPTGKDHYTKPIGDKPRRTLFITLD